MKDVNRKILLNPGPATTTDAVKWAQVVSDICPREADFVNLIKRIRKNLVSWVADETTHDAVIFGASGTGAVEAVLTSLPPGKVFVINNGAYGHRMIQILETYGVDTIEFNSSSIKRIDFSSLEKAMSDTKPEHVAMVHHETTTGLLNDISRVGNLCQKYSATFIVDAMSSYGAIPIDMASTHVDYLVASSNKNLQGMAGCSFVIGKHEFFKMLPPSKSFYFDLGAQYRALNNTGQTRFTPPVQVLYALEKALQELKQEGIARRYERYVSLWQRLMKGLKKYDLSCLVPETEQSKLITAVIPPSSPHYDFQKMHDFFYERDITIYPGKLAESDSFRIANIGDLYPKDMELFVSCLGDYLSSLQKVNDHNQG
jgi:2-aminoethylphosphonate-pyruvate transaminase